MTEDELIELEETNEMNEKVFQDDKCNNEQFLFTLANAIYDSGWEADLMSGPYHYTIVIDDKRITAQLQREGTMGVLIFLINGISKWNNTIAINAEYLKTWLIWRTEKLKNKDIRDENTIRFS